MYKKAIALILSFIMFLSCCGCSSLFNGEYTSSKQHTSNTATLSGSSSMTTNVSNYDELCDALVDMISIHASVGTVRFKSYDGDPNEDIVSACGSVCTDTAYGSYGASYIKYSLNKIVSYYEAIVTITYRHSLEEMVLIKEISDTDSLKDFIYKSITEYDDSIAIITSNPEITDEYIGDCISKLYYENPQVITYLPRYSVTFYPESGIEHIIEITLQYPFGEYVITSRNKALLQRSKEITSSLDPASQDFIYQLCKELYDSVEYEDSSDTDTYDTWDNLYTAYGALVLGKATDEGLAMALKVLCNESDIYCEVVNGRLNNVSHTWNIVQLSNGNYYHVDISQNVTRNSFKTDDEMLSEYWWDEGYTECSGDSIAYVTPANSEPSDAEEDNSQSEADPIEETDTTGESEAETDNS